MISPTSTAHAHPKLRFVLGAVVVMLLGAPAAVDAQVVQGVQQGAKEGNRAAGPVGGVLGGASGGLPRLRHRLVRDAAGVHDGDLGVVALGVPAGEERLAHLVRVDV